MDWQAAININRQALLRLLAALVAITVPTRQTHNMILRVLRPAESAARRLIVIAARLYAQKHRVSAPQPRCQNLPDFSKFACGANTSAFRLFDPRKRFDLGNPRKLKRSNTFRPRISMIGLTAPQFQAEKQASHDTNAQLTRRLNALQNALHDLPKQAKRMARHIEKRKIAPAGPKRVPPLRPGFPPGYRIKPVHDVDAVLKECHALVFQMREAPS